MIFRRHFLWRHDTPFYGVTTRLFMTFLTQIASTSIVLIVTRPVLRFYLYIYIYIVYKLLLRFYFYSPDDANCY